MTRTDLKNVGINADDGVETGRSADKNRTKGIFEIGSRRASGASRALSYGKTNERSE